MRIVKTLARTQVPDDLALFGDRASFDALCARTPVLHQIETGFEGLAAAPQRLRVGAWNLERCKQIEDTAALIATLDLDVLLLSEMDNGMARSGNLNTTRALAERLGMTYAFAVEFIETGHGTASERAAYAGLPNTRNLHGNAILSRFALHRPDLLRLPGGEVWTSMDWHDARLGSRIVLAAVIETARGPMAVASLHFESLPGAVERAGHMRHVVDFLDAAFPGMPVLMGGDLNSADLPEALDEDGTRPSWFRNPEAHEPMFGVVDAAGFAWLDANTAQHTRRQLPNGRPFRPFKKVDWLLARGVSAAVPRVHPALSRDGAPVSDHEIVVAAISLPA